MIEKPKKQSISTLWFKILLFTIFAGYAHPKKHKILNFTPNFLPKLKKQATGPTLLANISRFLDSPRKDQDLLESILQSGNINGFFDYIQIFGVFEHLLTRYPQVVLGVESIGKSFQKNDVIAIRIGQRKKSKHHFNSIYTNHHYFKKKEDQDTPQSMDLLVNPETSRPRPKSLIMFTGAHHSRELLTQNMILKIILEALFYLLNSAPAKTSFWHFSDVLAIPFVNIDGHMFISKSFEFTRDPASISGDSATDKTPKFEQGKWKRKNMNSNYCPESPTGVDVGVDLNRNYGYQWGHAEKEDEEPCSEVYKGPYPFSEPETRNIRRLVKRERNHLSLVLNFHTYGNLWVQPFNFSKHKHLEYFRLDRHIVRFYDEMKKEILRLSPHAQVGNAIEMVNYVARGEASDWLMGEHGIVSYSPELGYSDKRFDNFFINRELINKALNENFQVVVAIMEKTTFKPEKVNYYLDAHKNFTIEFENYALGKVFEGILRLGTENSRFISKIRRIRIAQENEEFVTPSFSVFDGSGEQVYQSRFEKLGQAHSIPDDGRILEIYLPVLRNLSKFQIHFELSDRIEDLSAVDLQFEILFDEVFSLGSFPLKIDFGNVSSFSLSVCVLIMNLLLMGVYFISKFIYNKIQHNRNKKSKGAIAKSNNKKSKGKSNVQCVREKKVKREILNSKEV